MKDIFYINTPPKADALPLLFNMPHSGDNYPEDFLASIAVPKAALRTQEDFAVDRLFAEASNFGGTLMAATFPRSFIDLNREPFELDPDMFEGPLPPFINSQTASVLNGIGTIASRCAKSQPIYKNDLTWNDAHDRIATYYTPYHKRLTDELERLKTQFGWVALFDCHSMPSTDSPADIVIGNRFGQSCSASLRDFVCQVWTGLGYRLAENDPYAGGFITKHYGRPDENQFALQIEFNRALYMDEAKLCPNDNWDKLQTDIQTFIQQLRLFNVSMASAAQ